MISSDIYPGTPIEWLPIWVASIWRFAYFLAAVSVLSRFAFMTVKRHGNLQFRTITMQWMWWALVVYTLKSLLGQVERWGDQAVYEGLPLNTVAIVLLWLSVRSYARDE